MSDKSQYFDCWIRVATSLVSQALVGEPVLADALPKPMPPGSFGFAATLEGDEEGRFAVVLESSLAEANLFGEGEDQKAGWAELLKEIAEAATGELLAKTGRKCRVAAMAAIDAENKLSRAYRLESGDRAWLIQVNSEVRLAKSARPAAKAEGAVAVPAAPPPAGAAGGAKSNAPKSSAQQPASGDVSPASDPPAELSPGLALLLDVELEASLRFGAREMPLGEILDLGPGDVIQLDRHIHDPVDLIVGDKIVAKGEVVLVNGNFGLRVTQVAEPQRRLETIRCLF